MNIEQAITAVLGPVTEAERIGVAAELILNEGLSEPMPGDIERVAKEMGIYPVAAEPSCLGGAS
jgi:hypothetical protein